MQQGFPQGTPGVMRVSVDNFVGIIGWNAVAARRCGTGCGYHV